MLGEREDTSAAYHAIQGMSNKKLAKLTPTQYNESVRSSGPHV